MHLVPRLKVASGYVLQRRDHVDCEVVNHERPSEVGNDHVFVDPSFGGSGDGGGIDLFHPGRDFLSEVIHDIVFFQRGGDLASDIFEQGIAQVVDALPIDREFRVILFIGFAMVGMVLGEKTTVAEKGWCWIFVVAHNSTWSYVC